MANPTAKGPVSNDGEPQIALTEPYTVLFTIKGSADLLFHRWSVESVAEKAAAAKGSAAKKTDDLQSYVWRDDAGEICLPGEYVRQAVIMAAKFRQDPRSPRKSAMDLYKAAVINLTPLASLGSKDWDYLDQRRVMVQRNGVTPGEAVPAQGRPGHGRPPASPTAERPVELASRGVRVPQVQARSSGLGTSGQAAIRRGGR